MKTTVTLDQKTMQQVLESAVRTQAQMVLQSSDWGETTVNGFLISGDEKALLMEVTGSPRVKTSTLIGGECEAHMYCDQRYLFLTTITATPQWGETRSVALTRPDQLRVMDRRRFSRAKLAPSSMVKLAWMRDGLARRIAAAMLNISADGLSCRLEGPVTQAVDVGDVLMTKFSLPGQAREFAIEGTILNITHTDEGRVLLGLQFVNSQRHAEELLILRKALRGRQVLDVAEVLG